MNANILLSILIKHLAKRGIKGHIRTSIAMAVLSSFDSDVKDISREQIRAELRHIGEAIISASEEV